MATGNRKDPLLGYNFKLEIDGIQRAAFRECTGLDESTEGAGEILASRRLPGLNPHSNIVLKGGITDDHSLWEWRSRAISGKAERKSGSIILMDESGAEKIRWHFANGWPAKWEGPTLNATSGEVVIETLTIAHEGVTKA